MTPYRFFYEYIVNGFAIDQILVKETPKLPGELLKPPQDSDQTKEEVKAATNEKEVKQEEDQEQLFVERAKNWVKEYLSSIDKASYILKLSVSEYLLKLLEWRVVSHEVFFAYCSFRNLKYQIEPGDNYGFDFMLYQESEQKNEGHQHSLGALTIIKESDQKNTTFVDIARKVRMARNIKKELVVAQTKCKRVGRDAFEADLETLLREKSKEKYFQELMQGFDFTYLVYS